MSVCASSVTISDVRQVVDGAYSSGNFTTEGTYLIDETFNSTISNITQQVENTKVSAFAAIKINRLF